MFKFYELNPSFEQNWRAIILFGRNVASYKFALAKALLDLKSTPETRISLEKLAIPYSYHLSEHLKRCDKQTTSSSSQFLEACRAFNQKKINQTQLVESTVRLGFHNVIDAFHHVQGQDVSTRFFIDQRQHKRGILLTDHFFKLTEHFQFENLQQETEARWRLVETAWALKVPKQVLQIQYQDDTQHFLADNTLKRISVTSAKSSLNGYQKGHCFYCFKPILIEHGIADAAEVDHFFPHVLKRCNPDKPINAVANLVLACQECNRGTQGKFDRLPSLALLERLHQRNEYLINSHHPLRETLMLQAGITEQKRRAFLQSAYNCACKYTGSVKKWEPLQQQNPIF